MFEICEEFVAILCMALQVLDRREIVWAYITMHMSDIVLGTWLAEDFWEGSLSSWLLLLVLRYTL